MVKTRLVPDMNSGVMSSGESQIELKSAEMFQKSEKNSKSPFIAKETLDLGRPAASFLRSCEYPLLNGSARSPEHGEQ